MHDNYIVLCFWMLACIASAQWPCVLAMQSAINSSSWLWMDFSHHFYLFWRHEKFLTSLEKVVQDTRTLLLKTAVIDAVDDRLYVLEKSIYGWKLPLKWTVSLLYIHYWDRTAVCDVVVKKFMTSSLPSCWKTDINGSPSAKSFLEARSFYITAVWFANQFYTTTTAVSRLPWSPYKTGQAMSLPVTLRKARYRCCLLAIAACYVRFAELIGQN